jgi:multidrug efflux system membrane fusion protein
MKKILIYALAALALLLAAHWLGIVRLPFLGGPVAERTQTAGGGFFGRRAANRAEVIPVLTAPVQRQNVPVTIDAVGTVQALNTVVVRAQVEGRLIELKFRDGQDVKKGDVLALLDARSYQAQYDQAVAKKAQDEAQLENARIDLDRYTRLAAGNFGSRQQADTQRALVSQLEAQVRVDQAIIDNARAMLDHTTITAPIDGRTGLRAVDVGNLIRASDPSGLVTITQLRPVAAVFNLPQQNLRAIVAGQGRGVLTVDVLEPDNSTVIERGQIEVVDNQVDVTTGTVRVRAVFPNRDLVLWPGQFVNVRVYVDMLKQVLTVPSGAVQRGPKGPFVYVISAENKASVRPVTVLRQDERLAVVEGVDEGTNLVTTGFGQLTEGSSVSVQNEGGEPAAQRPARSPGQGQGQRGGARSQTEAGGSAGSR